MKKFSRYILLSFLLVLIAAVAIGLPFAKPIIRQMNTGFIIDAGHGLPDGGAIAADGTSEQILNLQIAEKLFECFDASSTVMVRQNEDSIATTGHSIREKKISDMHERINIASLYPQALWISIHMNTFPDSSVYGCQVFYRKGNPISEKIAARLQNSINLTLQPDHGKQPKPIDSSLYLFNNISNPAILIECGFISNSTELGKLKNAEYQKSLADLIYQATQEE